MRNTRILITGHRKALVEIVREQGHKVTVKRLNDAGRAPHGFDPLNWILTRRGDFTTMTLAVLEARTIR